jgi:two-component system alkaline phosphatase synthesis response regulator PhoP
MPEKTDSMLKPAARLLLVEDEINLGATLEDRLKREGYELSWVRTVEEALFQIRQARWDLVLLDVGLPDGSGFDVARALRAEQPSTGVIFITAFGAPEDRIRGLELGAEDYVVKPFHLKELLLRLQLGLRRVRYLASPGLGELSGALQLGKAELRLSEFQAIVEGQAQPLTHKEVALLRLLLERKGKVVSRDEILNQVWGEAEFPSPRTIDNFIMRLRRLIEVDAENPQIIKSIRGVGYQLI